MPKIIVVSPSGEELVIDAEIGYSLMQLLRDNGVDGVLAICGGCCSCATCHVYVDPEFIGKIPEMQAEESELLEAPNRRLTSRLSCQIKVSAELDGMRITVAPDQ